MVTKYHDWWVLKTRHFFPTYLVRVSWMRLRTRFKNSWPSWQGRPNYFYWISIRNSFFSLQKKAKLSHEMLDKYAVNELPLYNQPSDTSLYHENKRKWVSNISYLFNLNYDLKNLFVPFSYDIFVRYFGVILP